MPHLDHLIPAAEQAAMVRRAVFLDMVQVNAQCLCWGHRQATDASITAAVEAGATQDEIREAYTAGRKEVA